MLEQEHGGKPLSMTAERAIELLSGGTKMPRAPHSAAELDEACQMACDAIRRLYDPALRQARTINDVYAEHCRSAGFHLERLDELAAADKAGRVVILPDVSCTDADGEEALRRAMWDCNYKNNGVTRFAADAIAEKLCHEAQKVRLSVKTPLGDIAAVASADPDNPGIWVSIHKPGEEYEPTLALVEHTKDEADHLGRSALITRVWGDVEQDEYTDRVLHTGLGKDGAADEH